MAKVDDTLKTLVQRVARSFYEPKHIVVFDALVRSDVIKDRDLADQLGVTEKEAGKLCGKLKDDRLVHFASYTEAKEGFGRVFQRTHFYIDYKQFVDVVKWKVYKLRKTVEDRMRDELDNKGYICTRCNTEYSPLDVNRLIDPMSGLFLCEVCGSEVKDNDNAANVKTSQATLQRLTDQLSPILSILKLTDDMKIPVINVKEIMQRNYEADPTSANGNIAYSTNSGVSAGPGLRIEFESPEDEAQRRIKQEEAEQKRKANVLPVWHAQSTISGDPSGNVPIEIDDTDVDKGEIVKPTSNATSAADYESYYASLQQKQADVEATTPAQNEDDDDESEDDFEEVEGPTNGKRAAEDLDDPASKRARFADEENVQDNAESIIVTVAGQSKPFNDITEDDQEAMTADEYQQYYELYQKYNS